MGIYLEPLEGAFRKFTKEGPPTLRPDNTNDDLLRAPRLALVFSELTAREVRELTQISEAILSDALELAALRDTGYKRLFRLTPAQRITQQLAQFDHRRVGMSQHLPLRPYHGNAERSHRGVSVMISERRGVIGVTLSGFGDEGLISTGDFEARRILEQPEDLLSAVALGFYSSIAQGRVTVGASKLRT